MLSVFLSACHDDENRRAEPSVNAGVGARTMDAALRDAAYGEASALLDRSEPYFDGARLDIDAVMDTDPDRGSSC